MAILEMANPLIYRQLAKYPLEYRHIGILSTIGMDRR